MKIIHYGHACVLLEFSTPKTTRILIDPGTYSTGFESLRDLDALLFTHAHPDHIDMQRVPALAQANPGMSIIADGGSAAVLTEHDVAHNVATDGDSVKAGDIDVDVLSGDHAVIHCDLPNISNNGYVIDGHTLHPGDAFVESPDSVEILLLPVGGPWMKIGEAVDYLRRVRPRVVIPIHQAGLAEIHQNLHYGLLKNLGPDECEVIVLEHGVAVTI
jgi:L-ascorbate metabolism protein UlaG (beta-lactamase superfamily)